MSTTTDTFARFVDVLAETLDDHESDGRSLASRLHLSRFHFDRLVTAAAGEPPARLRRRILLERAAHRLITTDDELLPIALDAGYASHEAFTRAFRRAYGQAPSQWRRRPTQFRIDAPSKVHFNPPGGLRIPAQRKVTPMELLARMVEHNIWLIGEMIEPTSNGKRARPTCARGSQTKGLRSWRTCAPSSTRDVSTRRSSTPSATRRRCSPTAA
jgi:AraC-like DNA-binding protein